MSGSVRDAFAAPRAVVLAFLQARGLDGATTPELHAPNIGGLEGTRRVRELRALGHPVQSERLPSGYWRYWLGPPSPTSQLPLWGSDD